MAKPKPKKVFKTTEDSLNKAAKPKGSKFTRMMKSFIEHIEFWKPLIYILIVGFLTMGWFCDRRANFKWHDYRIKLLEKELSGTRDLLHKLRDSKTLLKKIKETKSELMELSNKLSELSRRIDLLK